MRNSKLLLFLSIFWITLSSLIFTTAASAGSSQHVRAGSGVVGDSSAVLVRFAFLADLHISDVATNVEDLEISVAHINSLKGIDFVIFAGDITEFGSDEEIYLAKSIIDKLNVPYYIVSGNHDSKWSESGCNTFSRVFGYEHFNFNFGGVQFIGTNSGPNMRMAPALVPRESMVWLDSVTRALPADVPVIFINHYPLDDSMLNYESVLEMLRRTNIQLSMCGHGHSNRVMDFSGVRGLMGRSNLRAGKVAAGKPGYNIVTITKDSIIVSDEEERPWQGFRTLRPFVDIVWEFQDNSDIGSAPASAFDMVYISNTAGVVKALDISNGSLRWSFATGGKIFSSPAICESSGTLVVGSSDNFIYGLDARSGALRWRVEAAKSVLGSPAIYNGIAYIGASDGVFRAIDVRSGRVVWSFGGVRGFVEARPWVDSEGVYIGDWANYVYAFDPVDGGLQWEWTNR
ncbi:MAG: PQQ-binding-like beta-propeller repeat protein, partial [Bacteroidales bacterium]|nr:PQQ-binding-like beta-propeller repeat protein [Bacteroidales bacterium]